MDIFGHGQKFLLIMSKPHVSEIVKVGYQLCIGALDITYLTIHCANRTSVFADLYLIIKYDS